MALTTEERRQLHELAGELAQDNPRLARALAGRWYAARARIRAARRLRRFRLRGFRLRGFRPRGFRPRGFRRPLGIYGLAVLLTAAAASLLIAGGVAGVPALIAIGAVAMADGPALFIAGHVWRRHRPPTP